MGLDSDGQLGLGLNPLSAPHLTSQPLLCGTRLCALHVCLGYSMDAKYFLFHGRLFIGYLEWEEWGDHVQVRRSMPTLWEDFF